jgi:gas vesicle protein GvpL/GvpF
VADRALYVYGVVPGDAAPTMFADARGVDPSEPLAVVADGDVAAVVSAVRLDEFGDDVIQDNLRDPRWLAEKARAHDEVLAAAVGRTTVVPFRFGAIYRDEQHVVDLLRERGDFVSTLSRLDGAVELGVKAVVDVHALRDRLSAERPVDVDASAGRAYMQRKQLDRELDEAIGRVAADLADESHERLAKLARAARANPVQAVEDPETPRRMILNSAYLVDADADGAFRDEVAAVATDHGEQGVEYEVTGPWPPYNFVESEEES